jgi:hypothetical protein
LIMLIEVEGYEDKAVVVDPRGTHDEVLDIDGLLVALPKKPPKKEILFSEEPRKMQMWRRLDVPQELSSIRSMDEWYEKPAEFRKKFLPYIEREFDRRRNGVWFYNNGEPTYITGRHYMLLQWTKLDIGHPYYFAFQRRIYLHMAACEADSRCIGQLYTKCRRSGYTNICSAVLVETYSRRYHQPTHGAGV